MSAYQTTPVTAAQFRKDFPEFASDVKFPDSQINFWATFAALMCNPHRFKSVLTQAMELFIAHNVALEAMNSAPAKMPGGIPGLSRGAVSGESGGRLSVSYDTASTLVPDAGHWNLTNFGTRLIWLVGMFGAGPIQVTGGCNGPGMGFLNTPGTIAVECGPGWCNGAWENAGGVMFG